MTETIETIGTIREREGEGEQREYESIDSKNASETDQSPCLIHMVNSRESNMCDAKETCRRRT